MAVYITTFTSFSHILIISVIIDFIKDISVNSSKVLNYGTLTTNGQSSSLIDIGFPSFISSFSNFGTLAISANSTLSLKTNSTFIDGSIAYVSGQLFLETGFALGIFQLSFFIIIIKFKLLIYLKDVKPAASISGSGLLSINGSATFVNGSSLGILTVSVGSQNGQSSLFIASNASISIFLFHSFNNE